MGFWARMTAAALLLPAVAAQAGTNPPPSTVPEPGTWALIGLAAAIGYAVSRGRRK